ncbi:MAG: hypothetical protein RIB98_15415 [Acidimicrobiales bacterium]
MFFPYRLDSRYRLLCLPLGVKDTDGVTVDDDTFVATFGRKRLATPMTNVTGAHATHGYRWWKAVGMRLSFADDGITFGTATHGGVCVHFDEPVRRVIGNKDHSALTVTVDDLEGLVTAIEERLPD